MPAAIRRGGGVEVMRENIRLKQQSFELSLGVKQVIAVLVSALLIVGAAFALGLGIGRKASAGPEQPPAAAKDPLAHLDEPLPAKDDSAPELKAHQALTDSRPLDKSMPVPGVNGAKAPAAPPPRAEERSAPVSDAVMPPAIAAPGPVSPPVLSGPASVTSPLVAAPPPAVASGENAGSAPPPAALPGRPATRENKSETREGPRTAVRAKPKAKPTARRAYTIQVASTQRRADAERVAKRLAARKPRIVAADLPGKGRWYRVQVGSYETRESARLALASMPGVRGIVTPARSPASGR